MRRTDARGAASAGAGIVATPFFARVAKKIRNVHMRDLYLEEYPWKKLIGLLQGINYGEYCCAEIPESSDPLRVLRYFRALLIAYQS